MPMSLNAVSKHLQVLERAGLIRREVRGRHRARHRHRVVEAERVHEALERAAVGAVDPAADEGGSLRQQWRLGGL